MESGTHLFAMTGSLDSSLFTQVRDHREVAAPDLNPSLFFGSGRHNGANKNSTEEPTEKAHEEKKTPARDARKCPMRVSGGQRFLFFVAVEKHRRRAFDMLSGSRKAGDMKALVKSRNQVGLWLEDVPEPQIGINDVKVRVLLTGICGTDLHIYDWDEWARGTIPVPLVIGHEFVGEIVEVGSNVNDFHPGELVSGEGHVVCGRCRNCLAGRRHLCANTQGVGVNRAGAFAEYIVLPMTNIWKHSPRVPIEVAAIFDPFGNAVHTALSFPVLGEDVLITGAGPIGIMAAAVVRHAGARYVVITDINPHRLQLAQQLGVNVAIDPKKKSLKEVQKDLGMHEGFDVGLEMSGNASAFREMLANMSHGGKVAMLGIPAGEMAIDWRQVIFNMLTIKGIYGREMYETWYKMTVMLESGLDISPVITHRFPYAEFQKGFDAMRSGSAGKVLLDWRQ
jgi:threonine 3-dehydrogenase